MTWNNPLTKAAEDQVGVMPDSGEKKYPGVTTKAHVLTVGLPQGVKPPAPPLCKTLSVCLDVVHNKGFGGRICEKKKKKFKEQN